ncbi:hypothetical protein DRA42_00595 [Ethanoligenens harbinense]|nr:hypothetical protein DRA42_00595 [Ethanoligenens harbinense]
MGIIMNISMEETFVKTFCEKRIVDRLIYELNNPKKRMNALWRFSNHDQFIKKSCIVDSSNKFTPDNLMDKIKKLSKSNKCYLLSPSFDGVEYSLYDGIHQGFYEGLAVVFIIDSNTAVIKDEQVYGAPTKYILHSPSNN